MVHNFSWPFCLYINYQVSLFWLRCVWKVLCIGVKSLLQLESTLSQNMFVKYAYMCHVFRPDADSVWMVGPLISKLPSQVQGRVLKQAGQVLESGNNFLSKGKFDKEKNQRR